MHLNIQDPPKLVFSGTPREIGLSHGHHLQSQIKDQMSVYEEMFRHSCDMDWASARQDAEKFRATIERLTPHLHEEMQGIADGAGVHILDIVTLNCRSEITFGKFTDGCTSLSWKRSDDCRILAQNWDFAPGVQRNIAFMEIDRPGQPTIYMVGEAGIVGKIGFNSACVGTCLNAIRAHPCISSKLPIHVALRLCLESISAEDAVQKLERLGGTGSSQHILVADSTSSFGLELSPLGNVYIEEDDYGMVTHTNHFLENHFVYAPPWLSGSPVRLARARQLSRELIDSGVLSEDQLIPGVLREKVFSDLYNAPQSICGQSDWTLDRIEQVVTLFNIVMRLDPKNLGAEVAVGQPGSGRETSVVKMPWR
ncbi:acyl-CoA:6-aminopenicillanic-acid-acyltransferase [Aspergillus ellipticus CBS 707.79]|uniref:Acyl-CoA:6-aminopenicillanic-acid-acyltransferase n=1 Tax=Aspergillus ellipticus CBS 707.79 TaxID=1448320 RepID=A0A319ERT1_9EURO|nr:acyl-CoA:6-aminopenicillanic-acid-acyltransferase [Aspergillus ellipticus CBS 707.79]